MSLPIRTTVDDIDAVCGYLVTKPTGATLAEAKAVVDKKHLDGRKLTALRLWGLVDEGADNKMRVTDRGRRCVRNSGSTRSDALREVIHHVEPYKAAVERAMHRGEEVISATDLAAHWYEHFSGDVSDREKILNDQAICFFHIAQGADLGALTVGRRGMATRFDFDADALRTFVDGSTADTEHDLITEESTEDGDLAGATDVDFTHGKMDGPGAHSNRVFITHGKNRKILDQVKELVAYGKYEPIVAMEHETAAKPVPQKVMDDMRTCKAAVIHVSAERILVDEDGNRFPRINENVLIEIGAAMALYGTKFVLLVEEGVTLPSNLQGLYECRYDGNELNMPATMKLLKAFSEF